jgi:glycosyltransferase involved in cell wall biosynthesis
MKVICIGNYPPRQCGIATFTENLIKSILNAASLQAFELDFEIIAMNDGGQNYNYPTIVLKSIQEKSKGDYIETAEYINQSEADICLLQHEYGIFGGESGLLILAMLRKIKIPIISTLHTVLQNPGFHQKEVLKKIAKYSTKVVVMNSLAINFLEEIFEVPREKIIQIQHGVPDFEALENKLIPIPENWQNRDILLTFGLIGRSKGIETVIRALPEIVKQNREVLYVVLGKTHPNIVRYAGEEYREFLESLVKQLGMENHVIFMNQYVTELELMSYLKAADIYVTPYLNKAQITSGTLSYAIGGGCAVVSTPYWHAEELLADGRGILFNFENNEELSTIINELLHNKSELKTLQDKAFEYGKTMSWPIIGKQYLTLFVKVATNKNNSKSYNPSVMQCIDYNISHLQRLTDSIGILQHARTSVPYFKTGYCLDDNTRALILCLMLWNKTKDTKLLALMHVYLSYIIFMKQKDGSFKNYLTFDRKAFSDDSSDDAFGRAFWAMGTLVRFAPTDAMFQTGIDLFNQSITQLDKLSYARGFANGIFGLYHYVKKFPDQEKYQILLQKLADQLCDRYDKYSHDRWNWFEESLTYDNGLLPASLYKAFEIIKRERYFKIAEESRQFLESKCFREDWLSLIGNRKWHRMDDDFELFAQQPVDALAMVILYESAHKVTGKTDFIDKLNKSFHWFLGENDLNISLLDTETGGCNDGIEEFNINRNQGAESTISLLLSQVIAEPFQIINSI